MNERDPDLEKLYREHSREEPPSALDAKILAAAHSAVKSGPRNVGAEATRPQRWWMPLAAAAVIGVVAIGIVQQVPKDTALDATSIATAPTPAPAPAPAPMQAPAPATTPAAPAAKVESQPAPAPAVEALAKKQKKEADAPASRPPPPPLVANEPPRQQSDKLSAMRENKVAAEPTPFPAAPPPQKTEIASSEAKRDAPMEQRSADARKDTMRDERQAMAGASAPPPPPANVQAPAFAPSPAPAQSAAAPAAARMRAQSESAGAIAQSNKNVDEEMRTLARDPDAWIVRIRKLRDEGNVAQAQRELKEFRALVPDAMQRLPADLLALASTLPP